MKFMVLKSKITQKIVAIGSLALLLSTENGYAKIDLSQLFEDSDSSVDFAMESDKSQSAGNSDTILRALYNDASRGENADDLKIKSGFFGDWAWVDPDKESIGKDANDKDIFRAPLTAKEADAKKKKQITDLAKAYLADGLYDSDDAALAALKADIKALEKRIAETKDINLKAKLESLLAIAVTFSKQINNAIIQDKVAVTLKGLMPSDGMSLSKSVPDMQAHLDMESDPMMRVVYEQTIKQLVAINTEVQKLKKINNNSIEDTLKKARESLSTAQKNKARATMKIQIATYQLQINQFTQIVAQLDIEDKESKDLQSKQAAEIAEIDKLVEAKMRDAHHPREALIIAQGELNVLQAELQQLKDLRRSQTQIAEKQLAIDKCNRIIDVLVIRSRSQDDDDNLVKTRVETLLKKYDGDVVRAFEEIEAKINPTKGAKSTNKIDLAVREALDLQIKNEEAADAKRKQEETKINEIVQQNIDAATSLEDALATAEEKLVTLQTELQSWKSSRRTSRDLQTKQSEIDLQQKVIDALKVKIEAKAVENKIIDKKVDELLEKNGGDAIKALKEINDKISNLKPGQKANPTDKAIADRLTKRVADEKANDPLILAKAKLKKASKTETPGALQDVASAILLKGGINSDNLSQETKDEMTNIIGATSEKLTAIAQDKNLSGAAKDKKKQDIIEAMVKNIAILVGANVSGVSQAALKSGDAKTIAADFALNQMMKALGASK